MSRTGHMMLRTVTYAPTMDSARPGYAGKRRDAKPEQTGQNYIGRGTGRPAETGARAAMAVTRPSFESGTAPDQSPEKVTSLAGLNKRGRSGASRQAGFDSPHCH